MSIFCNEAAVEAYKDKQLLRIVNEAYFGRTPGITRCFDAFCDFRNEYVGHGVINAMRHIDIDHDKNLKVFCREMEREFGLDTFSFIVRNDPMVNAWTYPIYFKQNRRPKDNVEVTKTGYRFKKDIEMSIIVVATTGFILDEKYSDEQVFAAILHEVGHNFQEYLNGNVHSLHSAIGFIQIINDILNLLSGNFTVLQNVKNYIFMSDPTHRTLSKWFNSITSDTDRNNIYSYFNFIRGIVRLPANLLTDIIMIPLMPAMKILTGFASLLNKCSLAGIIVSAHGYLGEVIADNFASYYGFGEALATGLDKMESGNLSSKVRNIPLIGHIYNFMMLPGDLLISLGDPHPAHAARAYDVLQSMKYDLKDPSLSPELRKKLEKEIESYENTMNKIYDDKSRLSNAKVVQGIFDKAIFSGGSMRYSWNTSLWGDPAREAQKATDKLRESVSIIDTKII